MKRVLLGVALATMLAMGGTASADGIATCGAALGVHNAATCMAANTVTMDGEPTLSLGVAIGPLTDLFYGDVTVRLISVANPDAFLEYQCTYRPTNGLGALGASCESHEGTALFVPGEAAKCVGFASGVGEWNVTCKVVSDGDGG